VLIGEKKVKNEKTRPDVGTGRGDRELVKRVAREGGGRETWGGILTAPGLKVPKEKRAAQIMGEGRSNPPSPPAQRLEARGQGANCKAELNTDEVRP